MLAAILSSSVFLPSIFLLLLTLGAILLPRRGPCLLCWPGLDASSFVFEPSCAHLQRSNSSSCLHEAPASCGYLENLEKRHRSRHQRLGIAPPPNASRPRVPDPAVPYG